MFVNLAKRLLAKLRRRKKRLNLATGSLFSLSIFKGIMLTVAFFYKYILQPQHGSYKVMYMKTKPLTQRLETLEDVLHLKGYYFKTSYMCYAQMF